MIVPLTVLTGLSGNLCCTWGQPWPLLRSCRHEGPLLPAMWGGWRQYSSSRSHWDPSFFLLLTREIERARNSFAAESPVRMWWGGCRPPGGWCLSFAFLDQIFLREKIVGMAEGFAVHAGKGCSTALDFLLLSCCALGLYKVLLIRYHSAFFAFIKGEEQKVNVYPSSECTCASTLPPHVLKTGYLQTLT